MKKIDELHHKIESCLKKYSNKRLALAKSSRLSSIEIKEGLEVYYPNKKVEQKG